MRRPQRLITGAALAVALTALPLVSPTSALGISEQTEYQLSETQKQVEDATRTYEEAMANLSSLQQKIDENTAAIEDLEDQIPAQQDKARQAMRDMYRYQKSSGSFMGVVLKTTSLDDIITTMTYLNEIQDSHNSEVERLSEMQAELEQKQTELNQAKTQAQAEQQTAEEALATAKQLRADAQAQAEREAAEELARLASVTSGESGEGADSANTANSADHAGQTANVVVDAAVNWNVTEEEFLATWTPRIDAYLAGSPLEGYGATFAKAAWDNSVDPRWSPAIAAIESSRGANTFRDFNAWGWMTKTSFTGWEQSINAHVAFLGRVYGTTLTPSAAMKYCPPTWQDWYNKVGSQMNLI